MPAVSMSQFIDFTVAQGPARVATAAISDDEYDPVKDFYKRIRERTITQFQAGWNAQQFTRALRKVTTPHKEANFKACRDGLVQWARGMEISGRPAPNRTWSAAGLEVKVNPELLLTIDGEKFVVKLYFKGPELSAARRENMLFLLEETAPRGYRAGILDARRGQLLIAEEFDPDLDALLISDAAALAALSAR